MWVKTEHTIQFDTHSESDMQYYYENREKLLADGWREISFTTAGITFSKRELGIKLELKDEINITD